MSEGIELRLGDGGPTDADYLALGRAIAQHCPTGFQRAVVAADLEGESELRIECGLGDGSELSLGLGRDAQQEIRSKLEMIRARMPDGARWRRCTVTLVAGGGFTMDVDY